MEWFTMGQIVHKKKKNLNELEKSIWRAEFHETTSGCCLRQRIVLGSWLAA